MDLRLHLLDATGGPLVEHPDLALTLADTSFLSTLQAGWEHGGRQSVCWSLTLRYPTLESLSGLPRLIGDSLGAAAMAGFLLLSQSQFYDQKCIILARVDGENLKGVEHEKEKLDAVCGWNASNASERIVRAVVSAKTALTQSQQQEFQRIGLRVLVQQTVSEVVQVAQVAIRLPASSSTAEQALARLASAPVSLHAEQRHLASGPDALSSMAGMWQMLDQQVGAREQTERRYLRIDDLPFEAVENFTGRSDEINQLVQHLE